jgi:hypothetical protein
MAMEPATPNGTEKDRQALASFLAWAENRKEDSLEIFFTPWGEVAVFDYYQQAIAHLTHLPNVQKVAIQTNLSGPLDWIEECAKEKIALWCTYHPGQVSQQEFLGQCDFLIRHKIRFSVGAVGAKENIDSIEELRNRLPTSVYLWVNAVKDDGTLYTREEKKRLTSIDPHFNYSIQAHPSLGRPCRCGHSVIFVDGNGDVKRCNFTDGSLGNLFDGSFTPHPSPMPCPEETCSCHIGYVHMTDLPLYDLFAGGVLERIPAGF